jgi:hypothetical protein
MEPTDYQGNARKNKEKKELSEKVIPDKHIEKIITTEVVVQKKSIGRKFRDIFVMADFKSVAGYVFWDVMIPAAKNMIADSANKGVDRMLYGESSVRRRTFGGGSRVTFPYNDPIRRGYSDYSTRYNPRVPIPERDPRDPRYAGRPSREDFLLSSREEAELVVSTMNDVIDQWDAVSVADLNELLGVPKTYVDNKWGWQHLGNVDIRQTRDGYLIDFPPAEPI